jgi:hypothetical protein
MSASKTRLLQTRRSTRSARSKIDEKGAFARASRMESIADFPTLRIPPSPKRILFSPMTVNL